MDTIQPTYEHLARDVLGCVYRFVLEHAYDRVGTTLPQLKPNQILRGWQSLATRPRTSEYCLITNTLQERHGTPIHHYQPNNDNDMGDLTVQQLIKHRVQVDFFNHSTNPAIDPARERAFIVTALANSTEGAGIFLGYNPLISLLYSEEMLCMNEVDMSHQLCQRYSVILHLTEIKGHTMPMRFTDDVKLILSNV